MDNNGVCQDLSTVNVCSSGTFLDGAACVDCFRNVETPDIGNEFNI